MVQERTQFFNSDNCTCLFTNHYRKYKIQERKRVTLASPEQRKRHRTSQRESLSIRKYREIGASRTSFRPPRCQYWTAMQPLMIRRQRLTKRIQVEAVRQHQVQLRRPRARPPLTISVRSNYACSQAACGTYRRVERTKPFFCAASYWEKRTELVNKLTMIRAIRSYWRTVPVSPPRHGL
jgi:hypothetical protein